MQGFVFCEFQDYVQRNFGPETWDQISEKVGVKGKSYSLFTSYPTSEIESLIKSLSEVTKHPYQELLEEFGFFTAPKLWRICKRMIPSKWTLTDLIMNITGFADHLLAHAISGTDVPPVMRCEKSGPDEVTIRYYSPRKMCAMGKGIVRGLGKQYGVDVTVTEPQCMLRGDPECQIVFHIQKAEVKTSSDH